MARISATYVCSVPGCQVRVTGLSKLRRHIKNHNASVKYCPQPGCNFRGTKRLTTYNNHQRKNHPNIFNVEIILPEDFNLAHRGFTNLGSNMQVQEGTHTNLPAPEALEHSIRPEYITPSRLYGNPYTSGLDHARQDPSPLFQHLAISNYDYELNRLATDRIPRSTGDMMALDEGSIRSEEMIRDGSMLSGAESDFDSSAIGDTEDQYGSLEHEEVNDHYLWK